jgi:hypothetical protein
MQWHFTGEKLRLYVIQIINFKIGSFAAKRTESAQCMYSLVPSLNFGDYLSC